MEIKYYVYAFDRDEDRITAALACPDEKTARRAYRIASQKMKVNDNTNGFLFGCVGINVPISGILSSLRLQAVRHGLDYPPEFKSFRDISPRERSLDSFNIDELEFAESETKKILEENISTDCRRDMQFMRCVRLAMTELTDGVVSDIPPKTDIVVVSPQENIPDFDNEGEFVDIETFAQRTEYAKSTLQGYCETRHKPQWIEIDEGRTLGRNKLGHYFRKNGDECNSCNEFFVPNDPIKYSHVVKKKRRAKSISPR